MANPYGMKSFVALGFQNSFDTLNTNSLHFIPFLTENVGMLKPPIIGENLAGIFDEGPDFEGPVTIEGDLETEAHPISVGMLISAVLGRPISVASDAIFTHTWEPRTADFDIKAANNPITYYKEIGGTAVGSAQLLYNMQGNTLELSVANGELTKAKVGFVGGTFSQVAAIATALPTGRVQWPWSVCSIDIGAAAHPEIKEMTVTVEENLEAMHTLHNSIFPNRIKRTGFRTIAAEGTLIFDTSAELQQFLSQAERELIVTFKGGTEVQSGFSEDLKIQLPLMRYREFKPEIGGPGLVEVSFVAAGKYSVSSATGLIMTLVNTLAWY